MKNIFDKIDKILKRMVPNLPTDNLYKFGFVGSLVLFVFFINLLNNKIEKQKEYSFQIDLKTVELDVKYESITTKSNFLKEIFNSDIDSATEAKFTIQLEKLEEEKAELDVEKEINNTHIEDFNEKIEDLNLVKFIYGSLIFLSCLSLVIFGKLWYKRVQIIEDKILKNNPNNR